MKIKNYISLDCKIFFAIEKRLKLVILYPILNLKNLVLKSIFSLAYRDYCMAIAAILSL